MPSANVTVTAKIGPGDSASSELLSNVRSVTYNIAEDTVDIIRADGGLTTYDYANVATVTQTVSGNVTTFTIST